ncbi:MAG: 2TM domain-containing protein [Pseudomonadota bacterium]
MSVRPEAGLRSRHHRGPWTLRDSDHNSPNDDAAPAPGDARSLLARWLRRHVLMFVAANTLVTLANVVTGPPWWGVWVLIVTGPLVLIHALTVKAAAVDETWVDRRTRAVNRRSYDRPAIEGVVEDLKKRTS